MPRCSLPIVLLLTCTLTAGAANVTQWSVDQTDAKSGQSVDALATITPSSGSATIRLSDLDMNPISDSQNISGFFFSLDTPISGVRLTSATGDVGTISKSGQITDLGVENLLDWTVTLTQLNGKSVVELTMLDTPHAQETIIGTANSTTGTYTAANGSIAGSVHNPFVLSNATFTITSTGLTASTAIDAASFGFGTSAGDTVAAQLSSTPMNDSALTADPEPRTLWLFLAGIAVILINHSRRRSRTA